MAEALHARLVFPVDRPPIENGVVTIKNGVIVSVRPKAPGQAVLDLGDVALLPGFVNAHTHLEFSHLRRPLGQPGMRLPHWIRLVIAERGRGDATPAAAIAAGVQESLASGVTTLGEIATAPWPSYGTVGPNLEAFTEVIGFSRARADSAFGNTIERIAEVPDRLGQSVGISPHAPYTVSFQLLKQLVAYAHDRQLPLAMHLAESAEEVEFLKTGRGPFRALLDERSMWDASAVPVPVRPLNYLRLLCQAPRVLVIHGNYLDSEEQSLLANAADRMTLVYCPRTHSFFQHQPYPLAELQARGVRVALGTDSRASNPDLNFLAEIRAAIEKHPAVSPQAILHMATLAGAQALGRGAEVGSLSPGKSADMVALPLPAQGSIDEQLAEMFVSNDSPAAVWLKGIEIPRLSAC